MSSTQATISRDIKELHLIKELTGFGTYKLCGLRAEDLSEFRGPPADHLQERASPPSTWAQNIVVIKTMPGLASAACAALDGMWRYRIWWAVWPVTIRPC